MHRDTAARPATKIERIEIMALEYVMERGKGYGNARGINYRRNSSIVTVTTSDGIAGVGEAMGPPGVLREYVKLLTPNFVGRSLFDFNIVATAIRNRLYHFGTQGHFISSLGAINIAVYDAIGKTFGVPVHNLLGGRIGDEIPCYATTGYFTESPKSEIETQLSKLKPGAFVGVKIKAGAGAASDVERVRAARKTIGDDILLMIDFNGNYTVDTALESLRKIEPYNILFCEEPLPPSDIAGYAELRRRSPIRIAAGEAHYGASDFKRLIDARALDIVQPSLTGGGGFDEMKTAAQFAAHNNLRVAVACWGGAISQNAAVHFAASLPVWPHTDRAPYPLMVEFDISENPLRDAIIANPVEPANGKIAVPSAPGLGIELIPEVVARYTI
jgi:D-galactarolactone cycloisomerase